MHNIKHKKNTLVFIAFLTVSVLESNPRVSWQYSSRRTLTVHGVLAQITL